MQVIGTHGSQKEIAILEEQLSSKDDEIRDSAKESLQNLLKDNPAKTRDILTKYKIIGSERCERFGRDMGQVFSMLGFRYSQKERFEGDNASEPNESVREYFSRKAMIDLLYETQKFGVDEGLLSKDDKEKVLDVWRELLHTQDENVRQYQDAISIFDSYHISPEIQSEETRSIKRLFPIPKELLQNIIKWLNAQGFETSIVTNDSFFYTTHHILARKDNKKGCMIYLTKTEGKRIWADVRFKIIGEEWTARESEEFQRSFWNQFSNIKNTV